MWFEETFSFNSSLILFTVIYESFTTKFCFKRGEKMMNNLSPLSIYYILFVVKFRKRQLESKSLLLRSFNHSWQSHNVNRKNLFFSLILNGSLVGELGWKHDFLGKCNYLSVCRFQFWLWWIYGSRDWKRFLIHHTSSYI